MKQDQRITQNSRYTTYYLFLTLVIVFYGYNTIINSVYYLGNRFFQAKPSEITIDKRIILNNGVAMPILAAGTWQYSPTIASDAVFTALDAGYRHIDTAFNYRNQRGVAEGITRFLRKHPDLSRYDLFVTTKVPGCGSNGVSFDNCGDDTHDIILKNLESLNMTHIDLLLIHFPQIGKNIEYGCTKVNCQAVRHQYKALQHAFLNKKARAIGVSNFCIKYLECLLSWDDIYIAPMVNQVQYHVGMGSDPEGLVSFSRSKGIVVQAYSPLGDGREELVEGEDMREIGKRYGKTASQISLKWIIENNVTVVSKSKKRSHLKQNLDLFSWSLDRQDINYLNSKTKPYNKPSFACDE